jgi:peptide chain release factor 2
VITFDPDALTARRAELEQRMGEPGFWDDQERAAKISTEHSRVTRKLDSYEQLTRDYEDAQELFSMDGGMEDEIASSIAPLRQELERLQEQALFSGEYDAGDAVVTLQSDVGGTDAQDFTEMLLRMYERWADHRGFETEVIDSSPGEEAGLKSATFTVEGENAYGILRAERGKHRLVRLSPFDQAHRRHTSFAQVIPAPLLAQDQDLELDEGDLRIDTYRAQGAGGQHVNKTDSAVRITHLPTGVVVQCQNERSQTANKQTAMRILKSRLAELAEEEREEELARERGVVSMGFGGNPIRSYFLHPYQLVKDHRTNYEVGNAQGVLDGNLDPFIQAYLLARAAGKVV